MTTIVIEKKRYVLLPEAEYKRLTAGKRVVTPHGDEDNVPAIAFAEGSIARSIVKGREAVGMSQKKLAEAAGIRVEVLNRAERGAVVPSIRTLTKIENALKKAGLTR